MNKPTITVTKTERGDWYCTVKYPEGGADSWYSKTRKEGEKKAGRLVDTYIANKERFSGLLIQ